jgi:NAD-dependent DNA ligase
MKQDDITRLKHIGVSRMKLLNDVGITTIEQLYEMPLEKLSEIKSISRHYAKLIKNSVNEHYMEKSEKSLGKPGAVKGKKEEEINRNLQKNIKRLNKSLNRADEKLKPLWKKKYLELYIVFKKRSNTLKTRMDTIDKIQKNLPKKVKKKIIKKSDALNLILKKAGKKPKKKKYKEVTQEIRSFSRMLRDISS